MKIDPRAFRQALGVFTTGVTVVTTRDASSGEDVGLTVNSFNSVSLDPPLVLWSLARSSRTLEAFLASPYFAVHVLAADQQTLSNRFSRTPQEQRFTDLALTRGHGDVPLLEGCSARFECRTAYRYEGGDHEIFVGEVITFERFERPPLAYQAGRYALALPRAERTRREARPPPDADAAPIDQNALNVLLGLAYHQLAVRLQPELSRLDISEADYWILNIVASEEGRTIATIADLLGFTGTQIDSAAIVALEKRGFLQLAGEGSQARAHLTERGRSTLVETAAITKAIEQAAEDALDYSEAQLLKQLLQRVIRAGAARDARSVR